ncbi:hypothetical protein LEM8419_02967 [Neolewinella maritima]|uniref:CHRD domain-containing protein n=1 Tax=Neolewinella maritima TaxID=1383882 RepID=A0ABM9B4G7_9BACT|nr:CHRD domain-containing protein [Neolewinella maritima]CAH1002052.1 hypothetical protein LEM8419_02967 [Neolewinella maritima]
MLSGQQQALPVATAASGSVTVDVTEVDGGARFVVSGSFARLSSPVATSIRGGGHIHVAYPGSNGGIIQPLSLSLSEDGLSGTINAEDNTFIISTDDLEDVDVGSIYVNIHTERYPSGELRGNLVRNGKEAYYTNLLGSNEVPSVISTAHGALLMEFDADDNSLVVTGSFADLKDTFASSIGGGAHLHLGLPGLNGGIDIALTASVADDGLSGVFRSEDNTFTLDDKQVADLRDGRYYANIHSGAYPSGEIRGQVLPPANIILRAHLSGANQYPPILSQGTGQVLSHVVDDTIRLIGSYAGLQSRINTFIRKGSHLHAGYAGDNGGIIIPLDFLRTDTVSGTFPIDSNKYTMTPGQRSLLIARGVYLNIHTVGNPMGELRGQMIPEAQAVFTTFLNGNQQIPSVISTGHGMVKVELMGTRMTATGSYFDLQSDLNKSIGGGAHLHPGYPGQSGGVLYPLTVSADSSAARGGRFFPRANTFQLTEGQIDTLTDRFLYVNIHSLDHPGGEIRGQVLGEATSYFLAPLSGASQPAGVPTDATGMVAAELRDTTVTLVGSFQDLDSDFNEAIAGGMHLHRNIAGSNGGILQSMATELDDDNRSGVVLADSNVFQFTQAQLAEMLDRRVYINVHTADYPSGAIRGQVLPLAQTYLHTTFSGANATNYVQTTAQGGLKLELTDSLLMLSGSVTMLEGEFDYSIAGGAHLHLAPAGQNGPITLPLSADTLDAGRSAIFSVDSNTYMLTTEQVTALRSGRVYANIHTTEVGSGEARGQIRGELNLPPLASRILAPLDGDTLAIGGSNQQPFRVNYAPTTDPDGDTVIYVWQLAADADFDSVLFAANTGRDTFFETNFGTVATLLDSAGVNLGDTATLYHRVLASDGSNYRPSAGVSIKLGRDSIVGTRDFLPLGFAVRAYPNPLREGQSLTYEIATHEAFTGRLLLYTQLGQLQQDRVVDARVGEQRVAVDMSSLPSGTYFLMLRNSDGRLINTARVVVQ